MRRVAHVGSLLVVAAIAYGCVALSGLSDLSVDPTAAADTGAAVDGARTGAVDGAGANTSSSSSSSGTSGTSPPELVDAASVEAATDSGTDSGTPITLTSVLYECVPVNVDGSGGLVLSAQFWPGFRFEVTGNENVTTTSMGLRVSASQKGTIFGAIVRLSSAQDQPDSLDLSGSDVVKTTLIELTATAGAAGTFTAPIAATLTPGVYAAVFGAGKFGAPDASTATITSQSGASGCANGLGPPFSIKQGTDAALILQATTPHFEVRGTRP